MNHKDKKPAIKPTVEEYEERVEFAIHLLNRRLMKSDIKRIMMKRFNVVARSVETYLSRARKKLIKDTGVSRTEHRLRSLRFYESVLEGKDATLRERMEAQARIDKLLGLERADLEGSEEANLKTATAAAAAATAAVGSMMGMVQVTERVVKSRQEIAEAKKEASGER